MCYNTKQSRKAEDLKKRRNSKISAVSEELVLFSGVFNGFTFPKTPVITNLNPDEIQLFHWGLIPPWAKSNEIRKNTLNARIETISDKPSFNHQRDHRCLILADSFYEWKHLGGKGNPKQKYEIGIPNWDLFTFAGIWPEWTNQKGEQLKTYSIVTTEAKGIMEDIHNSKLRMPVILPPRVEKDWLVGKDEKEFKDLGVELIAKTANLQTSLF